MPSTRAKGQGMHDVLIALAGGLLSLALIPSVIWSRRKTDTQKG
ncbi:hypothetical protein CHCC20331_1459 [Bacillus paralicheniformis]|nr:hypothetical protein CHCC5021_2131 [Bacillus paralicheniformis]TWK30802.1 hypothetical protein CHCC20372_2734 [Bacillus paralicheniformis]TWK89057.1 hypothetical protein CHCC20331_1459 [Bacillus paralicheniformis]TWL06036.1 hypothetical protein CHCC19468_2687 [Bacillus paralicheniformis]TWL06331.1 hypothetical protein CHCC19467_4596 [Bacillus paralicheniformis]